MSEMTTDELADLQNSVAKGDSLDVTIRVGSQSDTVTFEVLYVSDERTEIGLSLPGDDRQYGKLIRHPAHSNPDNSEVLLSTRSEDQHNADVVEVA